MAYYKDSSLTQINAFFSIQPILGGTKVLFQMTELPLEAVLHNGKINSIKVSNEIGDRTQKLNLSIIKSLQRLATQVIIQDSRALFGSQTLLPRKYGKEIKQEAESIVSSIFPRSAFVCFFCRQLSRKKRNCQGCLEIRYWQELRLKITKGLEIINEQGKVEKLHNEPEILTWPECSENYQKYHSNIKHSKEVKCH